VRSNIFRSVVPIDSRYGPARADFAVPYDAPMPALVVLVLLLLGAVVVLGLMLWSVKRHGDPRLSVDCDAALEDLIASLAGLTHSSVVEGNSVEVFENGAFFDALFESIAAASESVNFETFLWKEGKLGERLVEALCERRRAGVPVRVLLDADGCKQMGDAAQWQLTEAGCKLVFFHVKTRLRNIGVLNRRDHRKLVVIDGRVALLGGHCIVDSWLGQAQDAEHFRDLGVRLCGPAVQALQSSFSENWVEETGDMFVGDKFFPALEAAGEVAVHVARIKPEGAAPAVKILHHLVICVARKRLWIQNPYFLPEPNAIKAMGQAVARGVDVRVMVPSAEASDFPAVQHAAHHNFAALLKSGVRIFEYSKTLLHQKVMTADRVWCAVGSSNFDDRSFEINDEITLGIFDRALAQRFEEIFEHDLHDCVELQHESWVRRGTWHKLKDRAMYLFNEQL
jgi:cardiolipin synthase A/B